MESQSESTLAIFKSLCDQVAQVEFQEQQFEFFEMHKGKFEEGQEENQLEHTQVHEQYVYILDQLIEAKLREQYDEEQIKQFYASFAQNFKQYEAVDSDAVEVLYGFINFEKFKEAILKFKRGAQENAEGAKSEKPDDFTKQDEGLFHELIKEDLNDP
mmetsp:Transcript_8513/g.14340  ORF Transcript_8513/g.14340 Transcript_8513/m.14340 type:complete len:158 (-) Transcript_8513:633-1106(-)